MVFTWVDFAPSSYGVYKFPMWAEVVGWMMSMTSVMAIPVFIAWKVCTSDQQDTLWEVRCVSSRYSCSQVLGLLFLFFHLDTVC